MEATDLCQVTVRQRPNRVTVTTPDGKVHSARWRGNDNWTPGALLDVSGDRDVCHAALCAWGGRAVFAVSLGDLRKHSQGWGVGAYDAAARS